MKILILKNQITQNLDDQLAKFNKFFQDRAPQFQYSVTVQEINEPYSIEFAMNGDDGKKHYGTDFRNRVDKYIAGYDAVIFLYEHEYPYQDGSLTARKQNPINGTFYLESPVNNDYLTTDWLWKVLTHEVVHFIEGEFGIKGIHITDEMDMTLDGKVYYKNDDPYAPDGNYSIMLAKFAPYWSLLSVTEPSVVTLTRTSDNGVETLGTLTANGFTCYTLERPWKNNAPNVSCIPKGTYICKWTFSLRFLRYTYEVTKVAHRSGIRIHYGNFFSDYQGCIGLGSGYGNVNNDGQTDLLSTRDTVKKFETLMAKKDFILVIK